MRFAYPTPFLVYIYTRSYEDHRDVNQNQKVIPSPGYSIAETKPEQSFEPRRYGPDPGRDGAEKPPPMRNGPYTPSSRYDDRSAPPARSYTNHLYMDQADINRSIDSNGSRDPLSSRDSGYPSSLERSR